MCSVGNGPFEFPLRDKVIRGPDGCRLRIADPKLDLYVRSAAGAAKNDHRWLRFRFLLDSGSDFTMLPASAARQLGVYLEDEATEKVSGVGGSLGAWQAEITLKIGDIELNVPCLFSSNEDTPYLLGRAGLFSRFNITFDNHRKKIVLEQIDS